MFSRRRSRSSPELLDQVERGEARRDDGRCEAVREEVGPRALAQQLDDLAAAGDVSAARAADRLAERAGHDVDTVGHAPMLGRPAAARPDDADGVGVVDHDEGVVAVGEVADLVELREVAVHREDAVGRDQAAARAGGFHEPRLELVHVAVREPKALSLAQPDPVDDRGVVQRVGDHGVLVGEQRLEEASVRVEAGGEEDRVLGPEERREVLLERRGGATACRR